MKVGLEDFPKSELRVYPNPTKNIINIELLELSEVVEVIVYDSKGAVVKQITQNNTNVVSIALNKPAGIYTVSIRTNNNTYTKRVMVK